MPQGVYDRYPPEIPAYIRKHASDDVTIREMRDRIHKELGYDMTFQYIKGWYIREKLPRKRDHCVNRIINDEQAEYLISIIPGRSSAELAEMVKEKFGIELTSTQIRAWKKNHKCPSGYDTRFRPGRRSETKGKKWDDFLSPEGQAASMKTAFKKGHIPANHKPIGSIKERDGYLWLKVRDGHGHNNWVMYHRYVWEQANGPVPKGYKLFFLDGNRANCSLDNLQLVNSGALVIANQRIGTVKDQPELNKVILQTAELKRQISRRKKEKRPR